MSYHFIKVGQEQRIIWLPPALPAIQKRGAKYGHRVPLSKVEPVKKLVKNFLKSKYPGIMIPLYKNYFFKR
jgi:hypothetical protein